MQSLCLKHPTRVTINNIKVGTERGSHCLVKNDRLFPLMGHCSGVRPAQGNTEGWIQQALKGFCSRESNAEWGWQFPDCPGLSDFQRPWRSPSWGRAQNAASLRNVLLYTDGRGGASSASLGGLSVGSVYKIEAWWVWGHSFKCKERKTLSCTHNSRPWELLCRGYYSTYIS